MRPVHEITIVSCMQCGRKVRVPGGRRRRQVQLGRPVADFCSRECNKLFVAIKSAKKNL